MRRDVREGGVRKTLNFGHTIGHAIELRSDYRMLHGEAVAVGMVIESRVAERLAVAEPGTSERVREGVRRAGLPVARPVEQSPSDILSATRSDKKVRHGLVEYALPCRVGAMAGADRGWAVPVSDDVARTSVWLITHPEYRRDPKIRATADFLKQVAKGPAGLC